MWLRGLTLGFVGIASAAIAQQGTIEARVAEARDRLHDAFLAGPVEGRFLERTPGDYLFSPDNKLLALAPVTNPDDVGGQAVGPLVIVAGALEEEGRLRVEEYSLAISGTLTSVVEEAFSGTGWARAMDTTIAEFIGTEVVGADGEVLGEIDSLAETQDGIAAVVGVGGFLGVGDLNVGVPISQFEWTRDGTLIARDLSIESIQQMPEFIASGSRLLGEEQTLRGAINEGAAQASETAMADGSARAIVADLEAAARPDAMSVAVRRLDRSSGLGRRTLENLADYVEAYSSASPDERVVIARQWRELRIAIGEHFTDTADFKALYGHIDNYPTWRYGRIFDDSAAVVAIAHSGRSICSGVLVAEDMVLTAGHCFKRPLEEYEVWFGFVQRPNLTSSAPIRRNIAADPVAPPAAIWPALLADRFSREVLDYAIIRILPPDNGPLLPEVELIQGRTVVPVPQCLSRNDPQRGDPLYVIGYPQSRPATVHDNARIEFPFSILDGSDFNMLRLDVEGDFVDDPDRETIMAELQNSYELQDDAGAIFLSRRFFDIRDSGQPRMGIVADTFRGNSGGPVFDRANLQCVVGILSKGMPDTGQRRTANWKVHERVLPVTAVLESLKQFPETAALLEGSGLQVR